MISLQNKMTRILLSDGRALVALIVLGTLIRLYGMTRPFYSDGLIWNINIETLRYHFWESIFYAHAQPPLHNAIVGLLLKFSDPPFDLSFLLLSLLNKICSLLTIVISYKTSRSLGVSINKAFCLSLLICFLPGFWMADRWMTSESIQFLLLALSLYSSRYLTKSYTHQIVFALSVALLVWLKSFFHIIAWLVPLYGLLFIVVRAKNYRFILVGLLLATSALYLKNFLTFDTLSTSSWFGYNISKTYSHLHNDKIRELQKQNLISMVPSTSKHIFSVQEHIDYFGSLPESGIPVLDLVSKTDAHPVIKDNWNNLIFFKASKELQENTIVLLLNFPFSYLETVVNNIYIYFSFEPFRFISEYVQWSIWQGRIIQNIVSIFVYFIVPTFLLLTYIYLIIYLFRRIFSGRKARDEKIGFFVYGLFVLVYFPLISCLLECGEQYRFRGYIDPLFLISYSVMIKDNMRMHRDVMFAIPFFMYGFMFLFLFF